MIARLGLLFSLLVGCASDWKVVDGDGDGLSPADGDCWDAVEGPPGSGLSGAEIYPGAPDAPYDGFDADCAGNDDYDLDGDGYVTEDGFAGLETYAVAGTGAATLSGDCWDNPDLTPEGFTALNGFSQPTAADVNPSASDTWYDAVDANCAADDDFDADGDGYTSSYYADADGALGEDCFDDVADDFYSGDFEPGDIYPGATEFCGDEVDNDCDTQVDGDDLDAKAVYWYPDVDTDTFGDIDAEEWKGTAEDAPEGYAIRVCDDPTTKDAAFVIDNTDCDDAEETTYPAAPEYCDTVDNDCNGNLDDDYAEDAPTFYADTDSDGYGDPKSTTVTCDQPSGYSVDPTDCDDSEALICPGCAEQESLSDCMADLDDDGYGDASPGAGVTIGTDCDDDDATSNPGEAEVVGNEVDNDCSGGETCYLDDDNDGYVNLSPDTIESSDDDCTDTDEATNAQPQTDCDDDSSTTYPGVASADSTSACMKDDDGDSYGDASAPSGVTDGTDCDDDDSSINTAAIELTGDEVDQDCSGGEICYLDDDNDGYVNLSLDTIASADVDCTDTDEATDSQPQTDCDDDSSTTYPGVASADSTSACMKDDDGDNYGDASAPSGVTDGTDCDDDNSSINTAASEITGDEVDQDCDGGEICYTDADDDDYRPDSSSETTSADTDCTDSGEAVDSDPIGDCDDSDNTSNPGEAEVVGNEVDNDCSGGETCYLDDDNDGYVNLSLDTIESSDDDCTDTDEATNAQPQTDCDDDSSTTYPGVASADSTSACMKDDDGDSYGDASAPSGVTDGTDCDDDDATSSPGEAEVVGNEVDNDCSGGETCYLDDDNDGYVNLSLDTIESSDDDCTDTDEATNAQPQTDCDDDSSTTYPGVASADSTSACMKDDDGDNYGDASAPSGVTDGTDCDDDNSSINTAASEITGDEVDQDCDGGEICYTDADDDDYRPDSSSETTSADTDCTDSGEAVDSDPIGDCDDSDNTSNPGEAEVVGNEVDNDCSGGETCYTDADDDGYRPNASSETESTDDDCTDSGEATASEPTDDCDDNDATSNPGEIEVVGNEVDNDCSGGETCYLDDDNDGYRPDPTSTQASADDDCDDNNEATSSEPVGDCDDNDNSINPGATELCDGDDNDCDGITDEDDAADADTWYVDADGDGDGDFNTSDVECYQPSGYVSNSDDCDDSEPDAYSGAPIICNDGIADNDCDTVDDAECLFEDMDLSSSDVILTGPSGMQMGYVLSAGDITGYGSVDLLIGGFVGDGAYIVEGVISSDLTLGASGTHAITGTAGEQTGYASSVVGDVDNDGNTDILIGAYTSDETTVNGGVAYLMYGPVTNDRDLTDSADYDVLIDGTINQGRFGYAAIGVGDQDSDGYDDLLVSAYKADGNANNSGVVYLLYGGISGSTASDVDGIILDGEAGSDQAGWSLSAGDVNGDGGQDILIGANLADATGTDMGQAYFFASPISSTDLISADYVLTGGSDSDMAGESVAFVDVNDDGYDDLVVGAIGVGSSSEDGAVYIYFSSGSAFSGSADLSAATADVLISAVSSSGANLGASVASGGDVNGDGAEDLLLGADKSTGSNGSAYLFYGGVASGSYAITSADVTFSGYGTSRAGSALLGTDLDVDGYSDVIIGGYRGASDAGEIFVNFGVTE